MYAIAGAILIHAAVVAMPDLSYLFVLGCAFIIGDLVNRLPGHVFPKPQASESPASHNEDHAASAGTGA